MRKKLYVLILCKAFYFLSKYQVLFVWRWNYISSKNKTNFSPIHNTRPTICILFFLRYLYCNITSRILTWFNPQGTKIAETSFWILFVECCEMVTAFARNENIYWVIKKSLYTWWFKYTKLQVIFEVSPANLQTFIDTPNSILEERG